MGRKRSVQKNFRDDSSSSKELSATSSDNSTRSLETRKRNKKRQRKTKCMLSAQGGNASSGSRRSSQTDNATVSSRSADQEVIENCASSSAEPTANLGPLTQPKPDVCKTKQIDDSTFSNNNNSKIQGPNKNMIPEFDPSLEKSKIEKWLAKVNRCAAIHNWDEARIIHSALSKLAGNAKIWYQEQTTVVHSWARWQKLLCYAFPSDPDYAILVTKMLDRRLKFDRDIEEYYYDKMALLYACEISGKNAVDCIIHGIEDSTIRYIATDACYEEPEGLLTFLKDIRDDRKVLMRGRCV